MMIFCLYEFLNIVLSLEGVSMNSLIKLTIAIFISIFALTLTLNIYADTSDDQMNSFIQTIQEKYHVSAISLSVISKNGTLKFYGLGTMANNSPNKVDENSLFRINSITKTYTAALALRLIGNGQIDMNAPITKYLPEYKKYKNISVRQLLSQTSGIFDYTDAPHWFEGLTNDPSKVWTSEDLINVAYNYPNYFLPGQGWGYSNTNYVLLGQIIEKVTKKTMGENLKEQFFTPLHLTNTYYITEDLPDNINKRLVHGYFYGDDVTAQNPSSWQAAGAIISNTDDTAIWFQDLMRGKVLNPSELNLMKTLISTRDGSSISISNAKVGAYGMGVFYANLGAPIWFTPGISTGYRSLVVYFPKQQMTYALALNNAIPNQQNFVDDILSAVVNLNTTNPV